MRGIIMWRDCNVFDKVSWKPKNSFIHILLVANYENLFETPVSLCTKQLIIFVPSSICLEQ